MPDDLVEQCGYQSVDDKTKRAILGETQARICGLDIEMLRSQSANDEFEQIRKQGLRAPWSYGK